jgi:hypothetical protein
LYRQTAAFRPDQKWSLLAQAYEYERLAMTELETCFVVGDGRTAHLPPKANRQAEMRWEMAAAA